MFTLAFIKLSRAICPSMMGTQVTVIKFLKPFLMVISVSGCPLSYSFVARVCTTAHYYLHYSF